MNDGRRYKNRGGSHRRYEIIIKNAQLQTMVIPPAGARNPIKKNLFKVTLDSCEPIGIINSDEIDRGSDLIKLLAVLGFRPDRVYGDIPNHTLGTDGKQNAISPMAEARLRTPVPEQLPTLPYRRGLTDRA